MTGPYIVCPEGSETCYYHAPNDLYTSVEPVSRKRAMELARKGFMVYRAPSGATIVPSWMLERLERVVPGDA